MSTNGGVRKYFSATDRAVASTPVFEVRTTVQLDFRSRELTIKLVYYGPALSGKTTNLLSLHKLADERCRGDLMTLETCDDRTLFFEMLPLCCEATGFEAKGALRLRLKLFTVPGQVIHTSTRRLVLQDADGVAFVADSQKSQVAENVTSFTDLRNNFASYGRQLEHVPLVIQYNKQDLPNTLSPRQLAALAEHGLEPVYRAVATTDVGVLETLVALLFLTWEDLTRRHPFDRKFQLQRDTFITQLLSHMGWQGSYQQLLGQCLGKSFFAIDELSPVTDLSLNPLPKACR